MSNTQQLQEFSLDFANPHNEEELIHVEGSFLKSKLQTTLEIEVANIEEEEIDLDDEQETELLVILENYEI